LKQGPPDINTPDYKSVSVNFFAEIREAASALDFLNTRDPEAFTAVFNELYPFAFHYARKFVSREDADDIVSSVFTSLWLKNKQFTTRDHLRKFLRVSIKNACINHFQKTASRIRNERRWQYAEYPDEAGTGCEREEIATEKLVRIHAEIKNLPPRCRKVFQMAFLENLKNEDIARLLGVSAFTVKYQKSYALKALRMVLISILTGLLTFCFSN